MSDLLQQLVDYPFLSRIRRNHGLEHATIHVLGKRFPDTLLIGRSDSHGFYLFGEVPTEALRQSVVEALERLRQGEHRLAIHPNCGTNLVTAAILAGLASFLSLLSSKDESRRKRLERLPFTIAAALCALIVAQPLGRIAQQHLTTLPDPGGMEITAIHRLRKGRTTTHRILTRT
jgi:hypothetical protein